jgi:HAD superfamily hydrolase (TIGR01549 family)
MESEQAKGEAPLAALPRRPRAVLLDGMGTLVALEPPHERLRATLREVAGVEVSGRSAKDAFKAEIAYYLAHHLEGRDDESLDRLRTDCAAVLQEALGQPAAALDPRVVKQAMLDAIHFDAYADAAPALHALRAGGLRLVVASNWDCSLPQALAQAGLLHLVDAVVTSAVAGAAKPDPRLFEAALGAAGCRTDEAIHVGDSLENDVAGATAAGIAALLLVRCGAAPPSVAVIRSLAELPAVLGAGGRMLGRP